MDWTKVLQVAANYAITFGAGWGTGVLAGLTDKQALAFGFVSLGSNALGLHQAKPQLTGSKLDLSQEK
jgi:hypothetical protein